VGSRNVDMRTRTFHAASIAIVGRHSSPAVLQRGQLLPWLLQWLAPTCSPASDNVLDTSARYQGSFLACFLLLLLCMPPALYASSWHRGAAIVILPCRGAARFDQEGWVETFIVWFPSGTPTYLWPDLPQTSALTLGAPRFASIAFPIFCSIVFGATFVAARVQ
jgi:hypothetical protein